MKCKSLFSSSNYISSKMDFEHLKQLKLLFLNQSKQKKINFETFLQSFFFETFQYSIKNALRKNAVSVRKSNKIYNKYRIYRLKFSNPNAIVHRLIRRMVERAHQSNRKKIKRPVWRTERTVRPIVHRHQQMRTSKRMQMKKKIAKWPQIERSKTLRFLFVCL